MKGNDSLVTPGDQVQIACFSLSENTMSKSRFGEIQVYNGILNEQARGESSMGKKSGEQKHHAVFC